MHDIGADRRSEEELLSKTINLTDPPKLYQTSRMKAYSLIG
jgi:hypothetical protein